ncbi:hypothetical protein TNCV_1131381 [Trichonephila clavipes]|nr:hypothetical protein TNCV_1131381 [Trichonephila clavipes]
MVLKATANDRRTSRRISCFVASDTVEEVAFATTIIEKERRYRVEKKVLGAIGCHQHIAVQSVCQKLPPPAIEEYGTPQTITPCHGPVWRAIVKAGSPRYPGLFQICLRLSSGHNWKRDSSLKIIRPCQCSSTFIEPSTTVIGLE